MASGASESRLKQFLHSAREYLTDWAIAGSVITLTGFAPEHWFADLLGRLAIPDNLRHGWLQALDIRIGLVAIGVAIIAWDVLRRSRLQTQGALPISEQNALGQTQSPDPSGGDEKLTKATEATSLTLPDKPSIAVLSFQNLSGDPEQEYFTDGITEDIITELSRFHSLFVIARNSSFTYKGNAVDIKQVGRELGVRYVLEGSIRRESNRIRVTAQLIDALTGTHVWAEKYDRVLEDIFAVQEDVTQSIVAAIAPRIDAAEQNKAMRRRPEDLTAYDHALRANAHFNEWYLKSDDAIWHRALVEARKALALDPSSILALNVVAGLQAMHLFVGSRADPAGVKTAWEEGVAAATRSIELDEARGPGYAWMAILHSLARHRTEALVSARRAYELNPNEVGSLLTLAYVELMEGQAEQVLALAERAIRLSPRDPIHYRTNAMRTAACFLKRDYAKGLEYALLSVAAAPNSANSHANHVLVAVGAGDLAGAKAALENVRRLNPDYGMSQMSVASTYHRAEDRQRITLAWRIAAGLEDPGAADALR